MDDTTHRLQACQTALAEGRALAQQQRWAEAHERYRAAHDLAVDCTRLHELAHRHLQQVNWQRRQLKEWAIDTTLLVLSPLKSFELVAFFMKRQVLGGQVCARP